jgi:hypothetical protein
MVINHLQTVTCGSIKVTTAFKEYSFAPLGTFSEKLVLNDSYFDFSVPRLDIPFYERIF